MSLINALKGMLDEGLKAEMYGDSSVYDVLGMIDLEPSFIDNRLPVVESNCSSFYEHRPPDVSHVEMNGERYMIARPDNCDFDFYDEEAVKIMRARFLLLRGYYYPKLETMSHPFRQAVVAVFFGGAVFVPAQESKLGRLMFGK